MTSFGRSLLDLWHLDPAYAYLNHGTVGATPRHVLDRQRAWVERIEQHPARLMLRELANIGEPSDWAGPEPPLMRQAATAVADYIGAPAGTGSPADGIALVDNITTGVNAVLRSLDLGPDDAVAITTIGYGGVSRAATFVAERAGATVDVIGLPGPGATPAEFAAAFDRQLRPETTVAVVDHLSAFSALVLPVTEFIASCRAKDVLVLVDAAHVPGQIPLNLTSLAAATDVTDSGRAGPGPDPYPYSYPDFHPDFYVANLHKWCWTPRSGGFLWVAPEHRNWVHPTVISWGLDNGMAAEFDLLGTRDPSAFLVIPEVLEYRSGFGEDEIKRYIHQLCWSAANHLADEWDTWFDTPEEMIGAMAVVRLPERLGATSADAENLRRHLDQNHKVEVPIFVLDELAGLVVRICTQVYNDHSDIERLVAAVASAPDTEEQP